MGLETGVDTCHVAPSVGLVVTLNCHRPEVLKGVSLVLAGGIFQIVLLNELQCFHSNKCLEGTIHNLHNYIKSLHVNDGGCS